LEIMTAPILINGQWRAARATSTFHASNPSTGAPLEPSYPVSSWEDVDEALDAAAAAFDSLREAPSSRIAAFLRAFAANLEARSEEVAQAAAEETGLPYATRLLVIELGRTCGQLRQAADAAEDGSWRMPVIDAATNIRSVLEPIGPVAVFGPNNFPLAFNGVSGGDFAAAIGAGNPVIAKGHRSHPETCRLLADCANEAVRSEGLPPGTVQMVYAIDRADGLRLVSDRRIGGAGFTGSRAAGMALKGAADAVGNPIYLEMSSINPVVILPGTLEERFDAMVTDLAGSALMAAGQFCTSPGLIILTANETTERFLSSLATSYDEAACGTLLGSGTQAHLASGIRELVAAGATVVTGATEAERDGCAYANTLLRVDGLWWS
jgi:alpha-ketoglutaric semialdehyde dehydrogenase